MKKLILWIKWLFDKTEPKACTFEAYLWKIKKDKKRQLSLIINNIVLGRNKSIKF